MEARDYIESYFREEQALLEELKVCEAFDRLNQNDDFKIFCDEFTKKKLQNATFNSVNSNISKEDREESLNLVKAIGEFMHYCNNMVGKSSDIKNRIKNINEEIINIKNNPEDYSN